MAGVTVTRVSPMTGVGHVRIRPNASRHCFVGPRQYIEPLPASSRRTGLMRSRLDVCSFHRYHRTTARRGQRSLARASPGGDGGGVEEDETIRPAPQPSALDPAQTVVWGGNLPSTRRMVIGGLAGVSIGLVANFVGVTSLLLSLDGGSFARSLRLDTLFPVLGFKRTLDTSNGYEFLVPTDWLADQTLFRRAAERAERSLDPPTLRSRRPKQQMAEPIAAFGPPGNRGDTNMSVIVAPIQPGFRLEDMGDADSTAKRFLANIAPPESDRAATLLSSSELRAPDEILYYTMEYTVKAPKFFRHNVSVYASADDTLFTFNAQCPQDKWPELQDSLRTAAASFRLYGLKANLPAAPTDTQ